MDGAGHSVRGGNPDHERSFHVEQAIFVWDVMLIESQQPLSPGVFPVNPGLWEPAFRCAHELDLTFHGSRHVDVRGGPQTCGEGAYPCIQSQIIETESPATLAGESRRLGVWGAKPFPSLLSIPVGVPIHCSPGGICKFLQISNTFLRI